MEYGIYILRLAFVALSLEMMGCSSCGTSYIHATEEPKNLTSPNYPKPYPSNTTCTWWIYSFYFYRDIYLEFKYLDIEDSSNCENDSLTIYQEYGGHGKVIQVCGNSTLHEKIELGSDVIIVFQTNNNVQGRGFVLQYYVDADDEDRERDNYHSRGHSDYWGTFLVVSFSMIAVTLVVTVIVACVCHRKQKTESGVQNIAFSGAITADQRKNKAP